MHESKQLDRRVSCQAAGISIKIQKKIHQLDKSAPCLIKSPECQNNRGRRIVIDTPFFTSRLPCTSKLTVLYFLAIPNFNFLITTSPDPGTKYNNNTKPGRLLPAPSPSCSCSCRCFLRPALQEYMAVRGHPPLWSKGVKFESNKRKKKVEMPRVDQSHALVKLFAYCSKR